MNDARGAGWSRKPACVTQRQKDTLPPTPTGPLRKLAGPPPIANRTVFNSIQAKEEKKFFGFSPV